MLRRILAPHESAGFTALRHPSHHPKTSERRLAASFTMSGSCPDLAGCYLLQGHATFESRIEISSSRPPACPPSHLHQGERRPVDVRLPAFGGRCCRQPFNSHGRRQGGDNRQQGLARPSANDRRESVEVRHEGHPRRDFQISMVLLDCGTTDGRSSETLLASLLIRRNVRRRGPNSCAEWVSL